MCPSPVVNPDGPLSLSERSSKATAVPLQWNAAHASSLNRSGMKRRKVVQAMQHLHAAVPSAVGPSSERLLQPALAVAAASPTHVSSSQQSSKYRADPSHLGADDRSPQGLKRQLTICTLDCAVGDPNAAVLFYPPAAADAVCLRVADIRRLHQNEMLSDNIVDFYLKALQLHLLSAEAVANVHIFSSFFFKRLRRADGSLAAQSWRSRGEELLSKKMLFFPICERMHWSLAVVVLPSEQQRTNILYLDSQGNKKNSVFSSLKLFMNELRSCQRAQAVADLYAFDFHVCEVPRQHNYTDSGLYMLHIVELLCQTDISSMHLPLNLIDWFDSSAIEEKRVCILDLVKKLS